MRDPLVQWCERRTPSANVGGAVYSIVTRFVFPVALLVGFNFDFFFSMYINSNY